MASTSPPSVSTVTEPRRRAGFARLDPRRHLVASLLWLILGVVAVACISVAIFVSQLVVKREREQREQQLATAAHLFKARIDDNVTERLKLMEHAAKRMLQLTPPERVGLLESIQQVFPEFAWIGYAGMDGKVQVATQGLLQNVNVSARPWFQRGLRLPIVEDVHAAVLLERLLPPLPDGDPWRFIDVAAPVAPTDSKSTVAGVVGGHLGLPWLRRMHDDFTARYANEGPIDVIVAARNGDILMGPTALIGQALPRIDLTESGRFLVGRYDQRGLTPELEWTIVVRENADQAMADARRARNLILTVTLLAGLLVCGIVVNGVTSLMQQLRALMVMARRVSLGEAPSVDATAVSVEVDTIRSTMLKLVADLVAERTALERLTFELDERVAAQASAIAAMAEDARALSILNERRRIARDLHDTVAHELAALITQLRLIRKCASIWSAEDLRSEIDRAEQAARTSLAQARTAIASMRATTEKEAIGDLLASLARLQEAFATGDPVPLQVHLDLGADLECPTLLPTSRLDHVLRVVSEALRNVVRHAETGAATVTVRRENPATADLILTVTDAGKGFDSTRVPAGHFGVLGMREHARLAQLELRILSEPGVGTRIWMRLPIATPS
jgi:signal transduction histidine kinase